LKPHPYSVNVNEPPLLIDYPSHPCQCLPRKKTAATAPTETLEVQLWDAANKIRGAVPPTDYMHVCLGMVFLR
jgi:hypothetical protein